MSEENKVVICGSCSAENAECSKFCTNCGQKLPEPMVSVYDAVEAEILEESASPVAEEPIEKATNAEEVYVVETVEDNVNNDNPVYENISASQEIEINYGDPVGESIVYDSNNITYNSSGNINNNISEKKNSGISIASMICGILSILCCCISILPLVFAIAALVLGIISIKNNYAEKEMAIVGIITGGIGCLIFLIFLLLSAFSASYMLFTEDFLNELNY